MRHIRSAKAWIVQALHRRLRANGRSLEITKSGWLLIFLTLLVGAVAINSGANLLHLVFGALVGVIILSGVASERMLSRVRVTRSMQGSCFAGHRAPLHLRLDNIHSHLPLIAIEVEMRQGNGAALTQQPCLSLIVGAGESQELTTSLHAQQRGCHEAPPLVVATTYPWGFFLKRREIDCPMRVYVAPTPGDARRAPFAAAQGNSRDNATRKSRIGEPDTHYPYRPGDDPKSIDYKSSARSPQLLSRTRLDQIQDSNSFELPSASDADLETKLQDLSAALLEHQDQGIAFSLLHRGRLLISPAQSLQSPELAYQILATHALSTAQKEIA